MGVIFGMEITTLDITVFSVLLFLFIALKTWSGGIPKGYRLPPGPPKKFIIGNWKDMPSHHEWETAGRWADEYGDLVCVKIFNVHMVFVNSAEIARDLFDKRSSLYSDRTDFPMMMLMGWSLNIGLMRYGQWWRRHRRAFHTYFHPEATKAYLDIQTKQARKALLGFRDSPGNFFEHVKRISGEIIMEAMYGDELNATNGHFLNIADKLVESTTEAIKPGGHLIDIFPYLKYVPEWMPGAGFQTKARISRKMLHDLREEPFNIVKAAMSSGTASPSVLASMLERFSNQEATDSDEADVIKNTVAVSYAAGATTTMVALESFILSMVLYPETQRKAQAELDSMIGSERLVNFEDQPDLPYIGAICKEIMRWRPVFPLGIPHCITQNDIYRDFFIPKGTIVIGNTWKIFHNEKVYGPRIEEFYPERFLIPGIPDPTAQYGFGRRTCPGRYMANNTIWITVASLLQIFDVSHAVDDDGNKIPVTGEYTSGSVVHPVPFKCSIKLRSPAAEALLSQIVD